MSKNALLDLLTGAAAPNSGLPLKNALVPVMRAPVEPGAAPERTARIAFVASTGGIDRFGEQIDPHGWVLENFRRNPVFQNSHRYRDVGDTLGRVVECDVRQVVIRAGDAPQLALYIDVDFAVSVNPTAKLAYELYASGYLNAVSVGFIPLDWKDVEGRDGVHRVYTRQELLEVSAVGVPANPDCLVLNRA